MIKHTALGDNKKNWGIVRKFRGVLVATAVLAGLSLTTNYTANASSVNNDWVANTTTEISQNIGDVKAVYTIRKGDTLWGITQALATKGYQTSVAQLAKINGIANADLIIAGNTMKFMGSGQNTVVQVQGANGSVKGTYNLGSNAANTSRNNTTTAAATKGNTSANSNTNTNNSQNSNNNGNNSNNNTPAKPATINRASLESAITQAQGLVSQTDVYTIDTISKLQVALTAGLSVENKNAATQTEVDNATAAINTAINNLTKQTDVNKKSLQAAISIAQALVSKATEYTADSLASLQTALDNGQSVNSQPTATQTDVNTATDALNAAIKGLVKLDTDTH